MWRPSLYDLILLDVRGYLPAETLAFCEHIRDASPGERFAFLSSAAMAIGIKSTKKKRCLSQTRPWEVCRISYGVEANGRREQFAGFSKEERDEKVIALIDTIREHRPQPLISAVYPADYDKLWGEFPGVMPPDPYIFCLYHLLIEAADLNSSRRTIEPFRISLIFENNEAMRKKAGENV